MATHLVVVVVCYSL